MKSFDLLKETLLNECTPGESWQDELHLWQWLDQGVLLIEPLSSDNLKACDRSIVLSCAIHGNETAPIELLNEFIRALSVSPTLLKARLLVVVGNPKAIQAEKRFVDENLNRLFIRENKTKKPQNYEQKRAPLLMWLVDQFFSLAPEHHVRIHYDLHTAIRDSVHSFFAVSPYHPYGHSRAAVGRLQRANVHAYLLSHKPSTTFSHYSHRFHGAEAFTVELGKVRPFGKNDMDQLVPLAELLGEICFNDKLPEGELKQPDLSLFQVTRDIHRRHTDFSFDFDENVANFTRFTKGQRLGVDGDDEILVEHDNEAIVFPNSKVAVGQRAVLTVVEAGPDILV